MDGHGIARDRKPRGVQCAVASKDALIHDLSHDIEDDDGGDEEPVPLHQRGDRREEIEHEARVRGGLVRGQICGLRSQSKSMRDRTQDPTLTAIARRIEGVEDRMHDAHAMEIAVDKRVRQLEQKLDAEIFDSRRVGKILSDAETMVKIGKWALGLSTLLIGAAVALVQDHLSLAALSRTTDKHADKIAQAELDVSAMRTELRDLSARALAAEQKSAEIAAAIARIEATLSRKNKGKPATAKAALPASQEP